MAHIRDEMRAWVNSATLLIRFKPDREAVSRELLEHIEDKALDIQRIFPDMTEQDVIRRALDGMGDPYEIGRELGKIHKPWLGYLWRASQVLLWGTVVFALIAVLGAGLENCAYRLKYACEDWIEAVQDEKKIFGDEIPAGNKRLALYYPNAEARLGDCTISVPRAARYQRAGEEPALYIELCLEYDYPWHKNILLFWHLWAEDDLGNRYMENGYPSVAGSLSGLSTVSRYVILENVPDEVKWLSLHHEYRPGLDLYVDLSREVRG